MIRKFGDFPIKKLSKMIDRFISRFPKINKTKAVHISKWTAFVFIAIPMFFVVFALQNEMPSFSQQNNRLNVRLK